MAVNNEQLPEEELLPLISVDAFILSRVTFTILQLALNFTSLRLFSSLRVAQVDEINKESDHEQT